MNTRKRLAPASGVVRWLENDPVTNNPMLRITSGGQSHDYELERVKGGYKLWRLDPATFQLVCRFVRHDGLCDCPDATHRPERRYACKHVRAIRAALNALPF